MLLRVRNMEPIEIEKQIIKELQNAIDELFSILYNGHDDEIDVEVLRFEISDTLDFMEHEVVSNEEKEEILRLIENAIENAADTKELSKIYYQLHTRLQLLETRVDALAFSLLDLYEEEKEDDVNENKVTNNDVSDIISRIIKIDVSRININVNDVISRINKIDVSSVLNKV